MMDVLYWVERYTTAFEAARITVDIVCAGDSLTGWNNFGPVQGWPFRTYPEFLQELCTPLGLRVANGGIAGEVSDNGPQQIQDYLDLFPHARFVIMGMGTNDLGTWTDTETASRRILGNLARMVETVRERGKPHCHDRYGAHGSKRHGISPTRRPPRRIHQYADPTVAASSRLEGSGIT